MKTSNTLRTFGHKHRATVKESNILVTLDGRVLFRILQTVQYGGIKASHKDKPRAEKELFLTSL